MLNLFFNKETKVVEFSAQSMDDIDSAKDALESLLNDKKVVSHYINYEKPSTYMFINKKGSSYNKSLESLLKTHQLTQGNISLWLILTDIISTL